MERQYYSSSSSVERANCVPVAEHNSQATDSEEVDLDVTVTVEGQPALRLTVDELINMYDRMHKWLHEINPYVEKGRGDFLKKHSETLWMDLERVEKFIGCHTISISGEMMLCVLRDKLDQKTKVLPLSKIASLYPAAS